MIKILLFDFSRTLLFPTNKDYSQGLNALHKSVRDDSDYVFHDHFMLNVELLDFLKSLDGKFRMAVLTTGTIQNAPEIKPILDSVFEKVYTAHELGLSKSEPQIYLEVADDLGVSPSEIFYIDDLQWNIDAALKAGLKAELYTNNIKIISEFRNLNYE